MTRALIVLAACATLLGCPPDVNEPDPPPGTPCATADDCTPADAPCGVVYACVAHVCETEPSRSMPCDGGI